MKVKRLLNKSLIFALCLVIILGNILIKHGFTGVSDTDSAYAEKSDGSAIEIRVFEENGFTTKVTNTGERKLSMCRLFTSQTIIKQPAKASVR
ncbi:MAG: hypothetical protein ACLR56_07210 [Oscillospiraceae bacterium]